ncbi:alpha/beta hydrolase [Bacillus sp. JJ1764]|uniref:alpha/beta hydrolase n=1 Tax=Bacillus sp. JJ1764 TaxID=3122964 RepID=UPI002FFF9556
MASPESLMVKQFLKAQSTGQGQSAAAEFSIEAARQGLEMLSALTPDVSDVQVEKTTIEGIPAEWVSAPNAKADRVFLYLHGGAYIMGSCNTHRYLASKLSFSTEARVLVPEYRLAPEHPFPAALEDALHAYHWLCSSGYQPENIIIGGDSAGGGLTMSTLLTLKENGEPLPAVAVLISPWTDLAGTGESMETRKEADPWLSPNLTLEVPVMYLREIDPKNPIVSPIYADLSGLPPMIVHVGNDEILLDDSTRLVDRARSAGADVTFKIWEDMWHVFQTFTIPEGQQSIDEIGEFVKSKLR